MHDAPPATPGSRCPNCGAVLTGPFCAQCGQHAHESARSLHVLLHEVWHLFTHLDGRLWSTLRTLQLRPGRLTVEYFAERRARYIPPFRLYFVISVVFFGLATVVTSFPTAYPHSLSGADRAQLQDELAHAAAATPLTGDVTTERTLTPALAARLCARVGFGSAWLDPRLRSICNRQLADRGRSMLHEFGALVPKMMFVFLPAMALVMLALYHRPRRYYVEHLVFFLHLQSALFLTMLVGLAISKAGERWPALETTASVCGWVLFWYAVWYIFAALRVAYGQGRGRTAVKFLAVVTGYTTCFALALTGTMILSALLT